MASYQGWDVEQMKAARAAEDDMEREPKRTRTAPATSSFTGFTPINISSKSSHPPRNGSEDLLRNATIRDTILPAHPSRNPLVASYLGLDDESAAQPPDEAHHAITGIEAVAKAAVQGQYEEAGSGRDACYEAQEKATHEAVTSDVIDFAYQPPRELESRHVNVPSSRSPFPDDVQAKGVGYTLSKRIISELDASRPQSLSTPGSYGDKLESESPLLPSSDRVPVIAHVTSLDAVKAQQGSRCSVYVGSSQPDSSQSFSQGKNVSTRLIDGVLSYESGASLAARSNLSECGRDNPPHDYGREAHSAHNPTGGKRSQPESVRPVAYTPRRRVLEVIEELPEEESPTPRKFKPGLRSTQNPAGLVQSYSEARGLDVPCFEPATASGSTELDDFDADVDDEELIRLAARFARGVPIPAACDDPMEWTALIDSDDAEFLGLTQDLEVNPPTLEQHSATEPAKAVSKRQMRVYSPKSSSTPFSASPANETRTQLDGDDAFRPIVRPPFPCQVQDRSPIVGLSATSVLRTCVRAGEALNVGCQAVREGRTIIIELYATVRSSFRESDSVKQHFVIGDLFHDRPPYINAVYELWKGVDLWDYDSSPFLEQSDAKRMCRCIGKMKREDRKWKLLVLNIWEASWEDIDYVKGIICA
ncbi:hypothetical protein H2199_006035 [Coniosporium tulheliwenetii]|uniref:Uncharacterized protein n=1 Tax=Coniosporium tulheliwenetii TaxID=3383036 RepID=A0ACC2YZN4_9PEZI|nr:hypothetical protein H2199_006035 [Cladosporium sp. JES 115]